MFEQSTGVLKAAVAGLTAERCHVHSALVPPYDNSALSRSAKASSSASAPHTPSMNLLVDLFLMSLKLEIVEKGAPTQVTHEGLGHPMDEHVGLKLILDKALAADLALVGSLPAMDAHVALQILLKSEAGSTDLTDDASTTVHRLM